MSAPNTNIEKQKDRHRPSLVGIGFAVVVALGLFAVFLAWTAEDGQTPGETDVGVALESEVSQ